MEILEETNTMFIGSTETTAITVSLALCLLGLYPEIQVSSGKNIHNYIYFLVEKCARRT
jgi:cytochrome P450